ncbi:MAG: cytochrome c [Lentisphaeraceae bacterium]|nr:cytochrome c [Lentisphaeraceae bacterium]
MLRITITLLLSAILTSNAFTNEESIARGKKIYDMVCFACHGKDLEGATGFNLKDSEWMHGNKPEQILATIKNGFPDKGMIAFGAIYKEEQLKDIVNFILSKQEGLRELHYEIYQGITSDTKMQNIKWTSLKADKSGTVKPAYIDFNIPEVDAFGMKFQGKLLIPEDGSYTLSAGLRQNSHFDLFIDGKALKYKIKNKRFSTKIDLSKGEHTFEARMVKIDKYCHINLNLKKKGYNIPLSMTSFRQIRDQKVVIGATKEPLVMRKRIDGVPTKTIAVAYPEKVNYAFNPQNGSINAMWLGEFLDVAPNINGRGNKGSVPLGKYLFNGTNGIDLLIQGKNPEVNYIKYSTYKGVVFTYTANGKRVTISSSVQGQSLVLTYKTDTTEEISLALPQGVQISTKNGSVNNGFLKINPDDNKEFTIVVAK